MSSSAGVRCIGWEGKLLRVGFRGFPHAQVAQLKSLARRGIFFSGPVLSCLADRPVAASALFGRILREPSLRSAALNQTVSQTSRQAKFPIKLSLIPADCLDAEFLRAHRNVKTIIASRDDGNIPYTKALNVQLGGTIGNTEFAEKVLPLLRVHIPKWMRLLPREKAYREPGKFHTAPWEYVQDLHDTFNKAGCPLHLNHAEIGGKAVFVAIDSGRPGDDGPREIVRVEIDPLDPKPIW